MLNVDGDELLVLDHVYGQAGTYNVTASEKDDLSPQATSNTAAITVSPAAATLSGLPTSASRDGPMSFTESFADPGWGGVIRLRSLLGRRHVQQQRVGDHRLQRCGPYAHAKAFRPLARARRGENIQRDCDPNPMNCGDGLQSWDWFSCATISWGNRSSVDVVNGYLSEINSGSSETIERIYLWPTPIYDGETFQVTITAGDIIGAVGPTTFSVLIA